MFRHPHDADGPEAGKVELSGRVLRDLDKAILLETPDASEPLWLPKSKITLRKDTDGFAIVLLPPWLAKNKGLI